MTRTVALLSNIHSAANLSYLTHYHPAPIINPSRRPDVSWYPSLQPDIPYTLSPLSQMSYVVLLAFDCLPDTFPPLLSLQNLQLVTRGPANNSASSNHPSYTSRCVSCISFAFNPDLTAYILLQFCSFWASGLLGTFAMCIIYSITSLCIHDIMMIVL